MTTRRADLHNEIRERVAEEGDQVRAVEVGDVPAAAQRLDEQHAGVHPPPHDVDVVALVVEGGVLRGDDLQIGVDAADIAVVEDLLRALRGAGRLALLGLLAARMRSAARLSSTCWKAVSAVWR